jgi:GcrA cell cycle regulator
MTPQGWTDDRVETLKRLWLDGLSAAQVARRLGGVSRNAVIGKLYRLGLTGVRAAAARPRRIAGASPHASRPVRPRGPRPGQAALPPPRPPSQSAISLQPGLVRDLSGLRPHACKWPIGDPQAEDFSFCGRPASGEGPYCREHHQIAHRHTRAPPLDRDPVVRRLLAA